MMSIEEFVNRYPVPPPVPRGQRHVFSVSLSDEEYDLVTRLAHHPAARTMFDGALTAVVRHALQAYLWPVVDMIEEEGFRPLGDRLRTEVETHNYLKSNEQIVEFVESKANLFTLMIESDQYAQAMAEYDRFLDFVEGLGEAWSSVVYKQMSHNNALQKFRSAVKARGDESVHELSLIEGRPR